MKLTDIINPTKNPLFGGGITNKLSSGGLQSYAGTLARQSRPIGGIVPSGNQSATAPKVSTVAASPAKAQFIQSQATSTAPKATVAPTTTELRTPSGLTQSQAEAISRTTPAMVTPQPTVATTTQMTTQQAQPTISSMSDAAKKYVATLAKTPEELDLERRIQNVRYGTDLGIQNIGQQAIPMKFITGQQRAVEQRGLSQLTPLQTELERLGGERQAQSAQEKFLLDLAQQERELGLKYAPKEAEGFTLGKDQVRYDAQGNIIAGSVGLGDTTSALSQDARSWAQLVNAGTAKLSDVPSDVRSQVATALGQIPQGQTAAQRRASDQATTAITAIDNALGIIPNVALGAVGRTFGTIIPGSDARNLEAQLTTVKALIGFDQLQKMREASPTGGALGQVSERELSYLQSVAGSLDVGQSQDRLNTTLNNIKESFQRLRAISNPAMTPEEYLSQFPDATDQELTEIIQREQQSFRNVGGDTNQAVAIPQTSRLAYVNNNPGNLRFAGQQGATQGEGGFAKFATPEAGYQALKSQIQLDAGRGLTLAQFVNKYAPPSENDTRQYIRQIMQMTGADQNTPINSINLDTLARAVARKESSTQIYA